MSIFHEDFRPDRIHVCPTPFSAISLPQKLTQETLPLPGGTLINGGGGRVAGGWWHGGGAWGWLVGLGLGHGGWWGMGHGGWWHGGNWERIGFDIYIYIYI